MSSNSTLPAALHQTNNYMFRIIQKVILNSRIGLLAGLGLAIASLTAPAATNTFNFNNTTANAGSGPVNPANGATAINGTNLNNGDVVVWVGSHRTLF